LYYRTIIFKKCFLSPFTGEFGHLLAHYLPFVSFLYSKGVKVEYCGLEIHKPFFVNEENKAIVSSYLPLRDFFAESAPNCNIAPQPKDVALITSAFVKKARKSIYPYWDNDNLEYYFYHYRWWLLKKGFMKTFDLSRVYKSNDENAAVVFPRKWNPNFPDKINDQIKNNGLNWDYYEVVKKISPYFEKVYVIGHPVFTSVSFSSFDNIEVCITADNAEILRICSNSKLIITQHSGVNNLGVYTNCKVLMIYNGGKKIGDIETTLAFRKALKEKYPLDFAYSLEEIEDYVKLFSIVN
jgi:hypothetical protein